MRTLAIVLAALSAALGMALILVMGPTASAGTVTQAPSAAKCASTNRVLHQMAPTGMTWELVRPDTAKALHISPCSIILDGPLENGQRSALLITPHLRIFRS